MQCRGLNGNFTREKLSELHHGTVGCDDAIACEDRVCEDHHDHGTTGPAFRYERVRDEELAENVLNFSQLRQIEDKWAIVHGTLKVTKSDTWKVVGWLRPLKGS